jgi:hypothetical protein
VYDIWYVPIRALLRPAMPGAETLQPIDQLGAPHSLSNVVGKQFWNVIETTIFTVIF